MRKSTTSILVFVTVLFNSIGAVALAGDLITITGNVGITNREAFDPFRDAFFKHHDQSFKKAFGFDRQALLDLPQHDVTARIEGWPKAVSARGPLLRDLLQKADVPAGSRFTIISLDGYGAEFQPQDVTAHDWVVAIDVDGRSLGIGGRGPAWLMYDTKGETLRSELETKWVWSAFMIVAE